MALIASALNTTIYWNPVEMLKSIFRTILPYFIACIVLAFVVCLNLVSDLVLGHINPLLGLVVGGALSFYLAIVEMRILGLIYYTNSDKLGWF